MPTLTRKNGKILMIVGFLLFSAGFLGGMVLYLASKNPNWGHTPLGLVLVLLVFPIGPVVGLIGFPVYLIGARRWPRRYDQLVNLLRIDLRVRLDHLAEELTVSQQEVLSVVSRLRLEGEPITFDQSTSEVIYKPVSTQPSAMVDRQSESKTATSRWPTYEKVSVILAITGIIVGVLLRILS